MKILFLKHPKTLATWKEIWIDDEDFDRVNKYNWCIGINNYVIATNIWKENGDRTSIRLARFILNLTDPELQVDHIDRNPFNNQKENLRVCKNYQNMWNQGPYKGKYKGVCFHINRNKWISSISVHSKRIHLGSFDTEVEAARAYDEGSRKYHGEFGYLNFTKEI